MVIHRILEISEVNGPGRRFCIWTQGCSRNCFGCFNPQTHDPLGGSEMSVESIIELIPRGAVQGLTVSGGEPFEQPEELLLLLRAAHRLRLDTLVYTGFTYEELRDTSPHILAEIDILVDGPYDRGSCKTHEWAGSGNQRILYLENGQSRDAAKSIGGAAVNGTAGEIIIEENGAVTVTGYCSGIYRDSIFGDQYETD